LEGEPRAEHEYLKGAEWERFKGFAPALDQRGEHVQREGLGMNILARRGLQWDVDAKKDGGKRKRGKNGLGRELVSGDHQKGGFIQEKKGQPPYWELYG